MVVIELTIVVSYAIKKCFLSSHHPSILHGVLRLYVGIFGKHAKILGVWSVDLIMWCCKKIHP
jgi:hypothetical protein